MTDPGDSRRGLVVGTAGHVDHGKTSLVRALTGVETDRWREERERGLTIDIGFAPLDLAPELETGVVDVPGHEDFLKNMLAGATGIDVVLLVVAADEGPMPQTREHLAIARLLGIERGVVALTKIDRVESDWVELATDAVMELLEEHGCAGWPIVPVSSTTGEGVEDLERSLRAAGAGTSPRRTRDLFRLPVDRAFSIHGTGTVVTGTVWSGRIRTGDTVRLLPGGATARVRGLEVHGSPRDGVAAGRRCALALVGVDPGDAGRGTVLVADEGWTAVSRLGVRIDVLAAPGRPIEHSQRVRLYVGTSEVMARVVAHGGGTIVPGTSGWAVLVLESPVVTRCGDRGIVRFYSPVTTIAGLRVAELDPPRVWTSRTGRWERLLDGSDEEAFAAAVELAGGSGFGGPREGIVLGRPPEIVEALGASSAAVRLGDRWFDPDVLDATMSAARDTVERLHEADRRAPGVSLEAVRSALARGRAPELVKACLDRHLEEGTLVATGPLVSLPGSGVVLTPEEQEQLNRLESVLVSGGLQPPTVNDLGAALRVQRDVLADLLRLLVDRGAAVAVTPEIYVDTAALDEMAGGVRELLADGQPRPPTAFKERFGLSRKYLIPLLEHLDRASVTRRVAEGRILGGA
ncbi:MAG: selenocysteine-specific translation elongation factor [Gemmatimonadota bacterium]|nr:selenocysteine-specific translation elongation factor [Gemmatimonadota bacterium]